jgi:hypothetical protein
MLFEKFIELLVMTIPAVLVLISSLFYFSKGFHNEQKKLETELELKRTNKLLPTKIRAFERLILFLERIKIDNLIVRCNDPKHTSTGMRTILVNEIRKEFEHNISQQLFVSPKTWELVVQSKNSTINLINSLSLKLDTEITASKFSELLLKTNEKIENNIIEEAIKELKDDFKTRFK